MECLYLPEFDEHNTELPVKGDEFLHLKALRLRSGDKIMLTNGRGLCAVACLHTFHKDEAHVEVEQLLPMYGEHPQQGEHQRRVGLAIALLDNRDRMEFAIEKAVELGVTEIFPLLCRYGQRRNLQHSRIQAKAIAALKQCKRAVLPHIHDLMSIERCLEQMHYATLVLCDEQGSSPTYIADSLCIMVGPEGGFSNEEIAMMEGHGGLIKWKLSPRRLRAETAAVAALSVVAAAG